MSGPRPRAVIRHVVAMLALVTAFASPVMAVMHGVEHQHEAGHARDRIARSGDDTPVVSLEAGAATTHIEDAAPSTQTHPALHLQTVAVVPWVIAAILPPVPTLTFWRARTLRAPPMPVDPWVVPPESAVPRALQPRAPPLG